MDAFNFLLFLNKTTFFAENAHFILPVIALLLSILPNIEPTINIPLRKKINLTSIKIESTIDISSSFYQSNSSL